MIPIKVNNQQINNIIGSYIYPKLNRVRNNATDISSAGSCFADYVYWDTNTSSWSVGSKNIHIGCGSGENSQGTAAIAIGYNAGQNSQTSGSIAIGYNAGQIFQKTNNIAIGTEAGQYNQNDASIAIGIGAGQTNQGRGSLAVGYLAGGITQYPFSTAIGVVAGSNSQGSFSVALGYNCGNSTQGLTAIAIGNSAGQVNQGNYGIAIGAQAGQNTQGSGSIAIGIFSGLQYQRDRAISIGVQGGPDSQIGQGTQAISIGYWAGKFTQGTSAIAIGTEAGRTNQGQDSIAIGRFSGQNNQQANSIVINASGSALNGSTVNALYISPLRTGQPNVTNGTLQWDSVTKEITTCNKTFVINHPDDSEKYLVHACLEGPEAGVYYRGKGKIVKNETSVKILLPNYVKNLAYNFTVQVTPIYNGKKFQLYTSDVSDNSFIVYNDIEDIEDTDFFWYVQGSRCDIIVEPLKSNVSVNGSGPYKWIENLSI